MAESILERREDINVIVTTYDLAAKKEDNKFLRRLRPDVSFPHVLQNSLLTFVRYASSMNTFLFTLTQGTSLFASLMRLLEPLNIPVLVLTIWTIVMKAIT
jgi:hypothetical protein